jgi:hypothetical protein
MWCASRKVLGDHEPLCRLDRRALAASDQRRREADTARLERVAKEPPPGALSARFSPFHAESHAECPPRSRSAARPCSARVPARTRAPPECGAPRIRRSLENERRRPIRHDRASDRTAGNPHYRDLLGAPACCRRRPSLHAHLRARQVSRTLHEA